MPTASASEPPLHKLRQFLALRQVASAQLKITTPPTTLAESHQRDCHATSANSIAIRVGNVQRPIRAVKDFDPRALREGCPLSAILSSLTEFVAAGARPRTPLAKAIALVLIIKLFGIVGMKIFVFPGTTRPAVDATAMVRMIGPPASLP